MLRNSGETLLGGAAGANVVILNKSDFIDDELKFVYKFNFKQHYGNEFGYQKVEHYSYVDCLIGDMNADGSWNILDFVMLVNCVVAENCEWNPQTECAGNLNGDGGYNILDITMLANCILDDTCGGVQGRPELDTSDRYLPPEGMTPEVHRGIMEKIVNAGGD